MVFIGKSAYLPAMIIIGSIAPVAVSLLTPAPNAQIQEDFEICAQ